MGRAEEVCVVPKEFAGDFTAATAAAGTLIGLLFVSISLRSDTVFGENPSPGGRAMAGSAFTGLANAFFISLVALIPETNLGVVAIVVAASSIVGTVGLHRHVARRESHRFMLVLSLASYSAQLVTGIALAARRHDKTLVFDLCYLVVVSLAVALGRAWRLLQGKHEIPRTPAS